MVVLLHDVVNNETTIAIRSLSQRATWSTVVKWACSTLSLSDNAPTLNQCTVGSYISLEMVVVYSDVDAGLQALLRDACLSARAQAAALGATCLSSMRLSSCFIDGSMNKHAAYIIIGLQADILTL